MILSKWEDGDRRDLAVTFSGRGWELLKQEFKLRKDNLIKQIVYGTDRSQDNNSRAMVAALDMLARLETEIFAKPEPDEPFTLPQPEPRTTRY